MEHSYQYGLVILSILLAILTSLLALGTASRIRQHHEIRILWVIGGGISLGLGIWVMHFVGMLAYHLPILVAYDISYTVLSVLLAIVASVIGFYVISVTEQLGQKTLLLSALIMGSGIAGMHYTGIYAMLLTPVVKFDPILFGFSLFVALVASYFAIRFVFAASKRITLLSPENLGSSMIMGAAIAGMHYIAMEAQSLDPNSVCQALDSGFTAANIMVMVVGGVFMILLLNALILGYDLKMAEARGEMAMSLAQRRKETMTIAQRVAESLAVQYKESEEFNKKLFDTVANVVMVLDKDGYVVRINKAAERTSGYSESELTGKLFWETLIPREKQAEIQALYQDILAGRGGEQSQFEIMTAHGGRRVLVWTYTALLDEYGVLDYIIATGMDITEQQRYEEDMRLAAVAFETNEAIFITDPDCKIRRVNAAFTEITGYTEEESYGNTPRMFKSGRHDDEFYRQLWAQLNSKGYWSGEIWNRRKNGEIYPEWLRITVVFDLQGEVTHYVATFSDISESKQAEEQIHFFSNFDANTHLPNRKLFIELLEKELEIAQLSNQRGAILYIELSQMDKLIDSIGMGAIDGYISQLLKVIHAEYGKDVIVGRISNTDLALLREDIPQHNVVSHAREVAAFIMDVIKQGVDIGGRMAYIHANIGIVDFPQAGEAAEDLLQHANTAANRARRHKPDCFQFYSAYMQKQATESYQLELALREAIEKDQFELYLQPQVNADHQLIGAECLIRWRRDGELVPPAKFIPLAEETNIIIDIGDWVIRRALTYIKRLESENIASSFRALAVNVSVIQFQQPDFIAKLKREIIAHKVDPAYLKLEITESAVLQRPEEIINKIHALKEIGVTVALDDFGTGYSSLSYLQKMQLDQLKIDRSFVADLSINKISQALTETIIVMARNLEMDVIAEGVETVEEQRLLAHYGCSQYQGYYFSRPIEFDAFLDYAQQPIQTVGD